MTILPMEGIDLLKEWLNVPLSAFNGRTEMLLLGIRGCVANKLLTECDSISIEQRNLTPNKYSCTIIQIWQGKLMAFNATTIPGKDYTEHPENPQGVARLIPGLWSFKRGLHKGNEALVQNNNMIILRDTDEDYNMDYDSDYLQTGMFGINNHAGGPNNIQKWSAGCQVIEGDAAGGGYHSWDSIEWKTYKERAYSASNNTYNYILVPYSWIRDILENKVDYCFYGSQGQVVKAIQTKLGIKPDGNYGEFTFRAVMKWQKEHGLQSNGCCGSTTLKEMQL